MIFDETKQMTQPFIGPRKHAPFALYAGHPQQDKKTQPTINQAIDGAIRVNATELYMFRH